MPRISTRNEAGGPGKQRSHSGRPNKYGDIRTGWGSWVAGALVSLRGAASTAIESSIAETPSSSRLVGVEEDIAREDAEAAQDSGDEMDDQEIVHLNVLLSLPRRWVQT